ncbi:MAG: amidohydrolase family protein [Phycisphaera sp.]|nr:amidohydrolase family protein [Phycisphaera sp.]
MNRILATACAVFLPALSASAQSVPPPEDIRVVENRRDALVNATVVTRPGETLEGATILLRDGLVEAVGVDIDAPKGYRVRDLEGLHVYPGFIDAGVSVPAGDALTRARSGAGAHWSPKIVPQISMRDSAGLDAARRKSLRHAGFTIAQVLPEDGLLRGRGTVVLVADRDRDRRTIIDGMQTAAFETGGWGGGYPNSQMGAISLVRQSLAEAEWHDRALAIHAMDPVGIDPPEQADALMALASVVSGDVPIAFVTNNELEAVRAARVADEYGLDAAIIGSGTEFRRLDEVVATGLPIVVPLKFPKKPEVTDPYAADRVTLRDLQTWEHAPSNAARLLDRGATVALTSRELSSPAAFHAAVRKAIEAGLPADEALACITVRPARMLGIDSVAGTIAPGRLANLVVTKGELFTKEAKIREVWVGGRRDEVKATIRFPVGGDFDVIVAGEMQEGLEASIDRDKNSLKIGPVKAEEDAEEPGEEDDPAEGTDTDVDPESDDDSDGDMPLRDDPVSGTWECVIDVPEMGELPVTVDVMLGEDDRVTGGLSSQMFSAELGGRFDRGSSTIDVSMSMEGGPSAELELKITGNSLEGSSEMMGGRTANVTGSKVAGLEDDEEATEKPRDRRASSRLRNIKLGSHGLGFAGDGEMFGLEGDVVGTAVVINDRVVGSLQTLDGRFVPFELVPRVAEESTETTEEGEEETDAEEEDEQPETPDLGPLPVPLGVYGRLEPVKPRTVVVRNADIWTCADEGILEDTDMLVKEGRIVAIGRDLEAPDDATIIEAEGLHLSPGLIDCHSHTGISGGVNEGAQTNTAEVRIGDVIDPDDIDWYRQLAGGLTAANQLHGSANPIGGQNSVVKIRWGGTIDDMRLDTAPSGIKFALGENVKRGGAYPNTRMGVASFMEDAFQAATERQAEFERFEALSPEEQARTLPPRPDFELDAIAEILAGDRLIHCHSYRQDEILMLLRLCERYDVRIGTLQHILEGYKVADEIAAHGAGASSFSDWWAYKMEVMDAIPYSGTLMHEVGVLVSFNSDDDELATRMNDEAAKAVRWGGLDEAEALKFVTLNPAKQLGIDDRVGSIEIGKDADFVLWSDSPLSSYARCEQTWIDGGRLYHREEARAAHAEAMRERGRLLAKASGAPDPEDEKKPPAAGEGKQGSRPAGLLARMLDDRERFLLERVARGEDPAAIEAGECGCGSGSMIELARSLARDRARLETLETEDSR